MQPDKPHAGPLFNPCRKLCGFFPDEVVHRQKDLTADQKLLYTRLIRWAGEKGVCWHGFDTMAEELGKSEQQIRYDMKALEDYGLVSHQVRGWKSGSRQTNVYRFLWHELFGRPVEPTVALEGVDGNPLPPTSRSCRQDRAELAATHCAAWR